LISSLFHDRSNSYENTTKKTGKISRSLSSRGAICSCHVLITLGSPSIEFQEFQSKKCIVEAREGNLSINITPAGSRNGNVESASKGDLEGNATKAMGINEIDQNISGNPKDNENNKIKNSSIPKEKNDFESNYSSRLSDQVFSRYENEPFHGKEDKDRNVVEKQTSSLSRREKRNRVTLNNLYPGLKG